MPHCGYFPLLWAPLLLPGGELLSTSSSFWVSQHLTAEPPDKTTSELVVTGTALAKRTSC